MALDAARPTVVAGDGQRDFPFKVSESDPDDLEVTADASAYGVCRHLEPAWSGGDRKGTLVVDDGGRSFRASGDNGRPAYEFPLGARRWSKSAGGCAGSPGRCCRVPQTARPARPSSADDMSWRPTTESSSSRAAP